MVTRDGRAALKTAPQGSVKVRWHAATAEAKLEALLGEGDPRAQGETTARPCAVAAGGA